MSIHRPQPNDPSVSGQYIKEVLVFLSTLLNSKKLGGLFSISYNRVLSLKLLPVCFEQTDHHCPQIKLF